MKATRIEGSRAGGTAEALGDRLNECHDQVMGCALTLMQSLIASPCTIKVGHDDDGNDHIWLSHGNARETTDFLCQDDARSEKSSWPLARAVFGEEHLDELKALSDEFHALALLWERCGGTEQKLVPSQPHEVGNVIDQQRALRAQQGR